MQSRQQLGGLAVAFCFGSSCAEYSLKAVEEEQRPIEPGPPSPLAPHHKVDILFVLDNSSSMGEEQAILARSFANFAEALDSPLVGGDYRISFTTSDNGYPQCSGTTPEAGALVFSSCLDRLEHFASPAGLITSHPNRPHAEPRP